MDAQPILDRVNTVFVDRDGAFLLVDFVVIVAAQPVHELGELRIPLDRVLRRSGDDQGRTRFVDQDRVDLVDDGVVVPTLHAVLEAERHVVAQVVEAELIVRAVGDIRVVCLAAFGRIHLREDGADIEPQEMVDTSHPL